MVSAANTRPGKRVLIVDDEELAREPLATILRDRGYEVRTAGDTKEATALLKDYPPDVAVVDIGLPLLSGEALAGFLSADFPKTRIVFISGQYSMIEPERFGENTVFLRKPLDINALVETIEGLPTTEQASWDM